MNHWRCHLLAFLLLFLLDVCSGVDYVNSLLFPMGNPWGIMSGGYNGVPKWGKFIIYENEIFFQKTTTFNFHYDFASKQFPAFSNMTSGQFDQVTLRNSSRMAVLGAILFPPGSQQEVGIQFVAYDPLTYDNFLFYFGMVKKAISYDPLTNINFLYFPTYEQQEMVKQNLDRFQNAGIEISSASRWEKFSAVYSEGWAVGTLKHVPGEFIEEFFANGQLESTDILLTDGVPAEVPPLAGILSLSASTPNSHVSILAQNTGIPFTHVIESKWITKLQNSIGMKILVRVQKPLLGMNSNPSSPITIVTFLEAGIDQVIEAQLMGKAIDPITISPMQLSGYYGINVQELGPANSSQYGGKASNFGILFAVIPNNTVSSAFAISFDVWTSFMQKMTQMGATKSVGEVIQEKLTSFSYPPNVTELVTVLEGIKDLIKDETKTPFPNVLSNVINLLSSKFDSTTRLRFRSSTNVEDSASFSGAGLYDSYSGCLADDLDSNSDGPSLCFPFGKKEKSVARAIRKVFASFYNLNAVLARMRHGVSERDAGMAILCHYSTPDDFERANGVVTVSLTSNSVEVTIVSQVGALSVTNAEPGSVPEETSIRAYGMKINNLTESVAMYDTKTKYIDIVTQSSLITQIGGSVLETGLYEELAKLCFAASVRFVQDSTGDLFPKGLEIIFDLEYKWLNPGGAVRPQGGLMVKQIRPLPQAKIASTIPFLINMPGNEYVTYQGESRSQEEPIWGYESNILHMAFGKSRLNFKTKNMFLNSSNVHDIFSYLEYSWTDGCHVYTEQPNYIYTWNEIDSEAVYRWRSFSSENKSRQVRMAFRIDLSREWKVPIVFLSDLLSREFLLEVLLEEPVLNNFVFKGNAFNRNEAPNLTTGYRLNTGLIQAPVRAAEDQIKVWAMTDEYGNGVSVTLWWPQGPTGPSAGYTYPLVEWINATIYLNSTSTIFLSPSSWWAQNYLPFHHNFANEFLFQPFLDPTVPHSLLEELSNQNRQILYVKFDQWSNLMQWYDGPPMCPLPNTSPTTSPTAPSASHSKIINPSSKIIETSFSQSRFNSKILVGVVLLSLIIIASYF